MDLRLQAEKGCIEEGWDAYIIDLLLQLDLGFVQAVDFVFLCLQVLQRSLVGLLQGLLLLGQPGNGVIKRGHLLREILHLQGWHTCNL